MEPNAMLEATWRIKEQLAREAGLEHSPVLACPAIASARRRKVGTFRFRDPLNKERRFIPLRFDACKRSEGAWC